MSRALYLNLRARNRVRKPKILTSYLQKIYHLDEFSEMLEEAVEKIGRFSRKSSFEAIAFTGTSGAAIAFPLSYLLKKPLISIRRHRDGSHYGCYGKMLEGCINAKTYLFVDDCIDSGDTARRVFAKITKDTGAKAVGIYLYDQHAIDPKFEGVPVMKSEKPWKRKKV